MNRFILYFWYLVLMWKNCAVFSSALSIVSSEDFDKPIQTLLLRGDTLFVGGTDTLYNVNANTLLLNTSHILFNYAIAANTPLPTILYLGEGMDNRIIFCSEYNGQCRLITTDAQDQIVSVYNSSNNIVANKRNSSVVFVNTKYDNIDDAIWVISSFGTGQYKAPALAVRLPATLKYYRDSDYALSGTEIPGSFLKYTQSASSSFVYGFASSGFVFYVKNKGGKAYIGATCDNDDRFSSLVEFPLVCNSDGGELRGYIQAATLAKAGNLLYYFLNQQSQSSPLNPDDDFLYAVFGADSIASSTSICIFSVEVLANLANSIYTKCHVEGDKHNVVVGPSELTTAYTDCTVYAVCFGLLLYKF